MYLGVRAVLALSFARIHRDNLVNFGILPLTFVDAADYAAVQPGDALELPDARAALASGVLLTVRNLTQDAEYAVTHQLSARQIALVLAGGVLNLKRTA